MWAKNLNGRNSAILFSVLQRKSWLRTDVYLHCTSKEALVLTVISKLLSAKHQYFPEWVLLAVRLSVSPSAKRFPSFSHVIVGVGFPVAVQWRVTCSLSMAVLSDGLVENLGGTRNKMREIMKGSTTILQCRNVFQNCQQIHTLNIKISSGIHCWVKSIFCWTQVFSRLIPAGFKTECVSLTYNLSIFHPCYLWDWISCGVAEEYCFGSLHNCLVSWCCDQTWCN